MGMSSHARPCHANFSHARSCCRHRLRRAVLSLDDDIMMPCADIERGFAAWRRAPHKIVGFYPRLITEEGGTGGRLAYNWEDATVAQVGRRCRGWLCFFWRRHVGKASMLFVS